MAVTGKPGESAMARAEAQRGVSSFGGLASSTRDGGFASAGRAGGGGAAGTGFRGPATTWGGAQSVVPGSALARQMSSPLSPYGGALNVTQDQLVDAALSNARLFGGTIQNPSLGMLQQMGAQVQASPQLQGVLGGIYGPFMTEGAPVPVSSNLLEGSLNAALPASTGVNNITPSISDMIDSGTYSGPKGVSALTPAARMASVQAQGLNVPEVAFTPQELDAATRMVLAESSNIVNPQGGLSTPAAQAVADVIRNRVLSEQFPSTVQGVLSQPRQFEPYGSGAYMGAQYGPQNPNFAAVQDVVRGVLSGEAAPVVGGAVNFGNNAIIQGRPTASMRTQNAFAQMAADPNSVTFYSARNPASVQQTFGVLPGARPVDFGSPVQVAVAPSPAPAPVRAVMPQTVAATPSLPPRTPTPSTLDRLATSLLGVPGYDAGPGFFSGAAKAGEYGTQLLAGSQPQVVEAASAPVAPPINRPTGGTTRLASLLLDRAMERGGGDRRRKRRSTTSEEMMTDTIGGLLA